MFECKSFESPKFNKYSEEVEYYIGKSLLNKAWGEYIKNNPNKKDFEKFLRKYIRANWNAIDVEYFQ